MITKNTTETWYPRLPLLDRITVLQAQWFDNSARSERKKGESDFSLKLFAWTTLKPDLKNPDWFRVVQLIDPKAVLQWAEKKHKAGALTPEQFAYYQAVHDNAQDQAADADVEKVWLGHVGSPPGKTYFPGQFVFARLERDGTLKAIVFNNGKAITLDGFKRARKRGRYVKPGSPKLTCLYDPSRLIAQQKAEAEALTTGRPLKEIIAEQLGDS